MNKHYTLGMVDHEGGMHVICTLNRLEDHITTGQYQLMVRVIAGLIQEFMCDIDGKRFNNYMEVTIKERQDAPEWVSIEEGE